MTVCQACRINQTNNTICDQCANDYEQNIKLIPLHINALTQLAEKTITIGEKQPTGPRAFASLPINEKAMRVCDELKTWLQITDSDIKAINGLHDKHEWEWHYQNITNTLATIAIMPTTPHRYDQLKTLNRQAERLLTPAETLQFAGTCPHCGKPIYCHQQQTSAYCHCGNIINVTINRTLADQQLRSMTLTATPTQASQWLKHKTGITIKRNTITQNIRRGNINAQPVGKGVYDISINDLINLANRKEQQ